MFGIFGKLATQPGKRDDVLAIFEEASLDAMPGCHLYLVAISDADPDALYITEVWDDEDAHEASLQIPDVRATIERAMPMLDMTGIEQTKFVPVVGVGLPIT